jgi:SAM-dependent methyltransferase
VTFEVADAARLDVRTPFDLIFVFDAVHDQVDPQAVLANIHRALNPDGVFFMKEPHGADSLEDNIGNPMALLLYAASTPHCMTVLPLTARGGLARSSPRSSFSRCSPRPASPVEVQSLRRPADGHLARGEPSPMWPRRPGGDRHPAGASPDGRSRA